MLTSPSFSASSKVTPPVDGEEVDVPQEEQPEPDTQELTTQEGSTPVSQGSNALPALPGLASLSDSSTTQSVETGVTQLAAPESALPGSITSINPTDVAQPLDAPATELPTNAEEVLPPEATLPPELSSTPSGGPIEVLPPASVNPELPAPVTGGAAPITDVAPPVGWSSSSEDKVSAFTGIGGAARCSGATISDEYKSCRAGISLEAWNALNEDVQEVVLGAVEKGIDAARAVQEYVEQNISPYTAERLQVLTNESQTGEFLKPDERFRLYTRLAYGLSSYNVSALDINQIAEFIEAGRERGNVEAGFDAVINLVEAKTADMRASDLENVFSEFGQYGMPDPGNLDPTADRLAEVRGWAVLGYTITGTTAGNLSGLEAVFKWQGMQYPDLETFNKNAAKGFNRAGWALNAASIIYEGHSMSTDPDFDGLADNWPEGVHSIPYWVRDGLTRSAIVLGKGAATTGAGLLVGTGSTVACSPGGATTGFGLGCGVVFGNSAAIGTGIYIDSRVDRIRDPYVPPVRQYGVGE